MRPLLQAIPWNSPEWTWVRDETNWAYKFCPVCVHQAEQTLRKVHHKANEAMGKRIVSFRLLDMVKSEIADTTQANFAKRRKIWEAISGDNWIDIGSSSCMPETESYKEKARNRIASTVKIMVLCFCFPSKHQCSSGDVSSPNVRKHE